MKYIFLFIAVYITSCNLITSNHKLIARHELQSGETITVYSARGSATSNDAIIVKIENNKEAKVIEVYERYRSLDTSFF